ncbi:MAG: ribosome recycling factor [Sphingobacteriaceae bacterium]|nr:ribosome recycling factor [Sphingobacteriaceae bacterium]
MNEEVQFYIEEAQEGMDKAIGHLQSELGKIRAGKASTAMLDGVRVDYYGAPTPLNQLASVNTSDARTLVITPWEKSALSAIERAIINANLGLNPSNDGTLIRINVPPLTEERRRELVKRTKAEGENAKVAVRNIRRDANEAIKKLQKDGVPEDMVKDGEGKVQQITDKMIAKVDELLVVKEKEIMTV